MARKRRPDSYHLGKLLDHFPAEDLELLIIDQEPDLLTRAKAVLKVFHKKKAFRRKYGNQYLDCLLDKMSSAKSKEEVAKIFKEHEYVGYTPEGDVQSYRDLIFISDEPERYLDRIFDPELKFPLKELNKLAHAGHYKSESKKFDLESKVKPLLQKEFDEKVRKIRDGETHPRFPQSLMDTAEEEYDLNTEELEKLLPALAAFGGYGEYKEYDPKNLPETWNIIKKYWKNCHSTTTTNIENFFEDNEEFKERYSADKTAQEIARVIFTGRVLGRKGGTSWHKRWKEFAEDYQLEGISELVQEDVVERLGYGHLQTVEALKEVFNIEVSEEMFKQAEDYVQDSINRSHSDEHRKRYETQLVVLHRYQKEGLSIDQIPGMTWEDDEDDEDDEDEYDVGYFLLYTHRDDQSNPHYFLRGQYTDKEHFTRELKANGFDHEVCYSTNKITICKDSEGDFFVLNASSDESLKIAGKVVQETFPDKKVTLSEGQNIHEYFESRDIKYAQQRLAEIKDSAQNKEK
jgi:hypothetical protein